MNEPKIRLKGFSGEWDNKSFCEIAIRTANKNKDNLPLESYSISNTSGFIPQNVQFENGGTMADADKRMYYIVTPNTFAYNPARINVGSIGLYKGHNDVIVSSLYEIFKTSKCVDDDFLMCWFKSPVFKKLIELYQEGGVRLYFFFDKLLQCHINLPSDIKEQTAIANYFTNLDTLIQSTAKKLDKLRTVKAASLQSLFPQEGEMVPRVRFKGFSGEWKRVKLKDITYHSGEKNRDNLPLESYSISNVHGFIPQDEQFENGGTMATADKRMYYIVKKESFAYNPARINVGSLGYYKGENDVIVSSLYEVFQTIESVYDQFLLYWFKTHQFSKLIDKFQEGGVRQYFFYDKLCECYMLCPSYDEQQKIASYLQSLDTQISLEEKRLEKLRNIKAACLDNMFV